MELILLILGTIAALVLFDLLRSRESTEHRIDELSARAHALEAALARASDAGHPLEDRVRRLETSLASLRSELAELQAAAAVQPSRQPIAPPAPAPASTSTRRKPAAATASAGAVPGRRSPSAPPAGRPPEPALRPRAGEPGLPPWIAPARPAAKPQPTGPGLVERAFVALGLAPAAGGTRPSRAALEAWLEGRMLAVVGGVALLLGAVFFLSLAFSRGWITEPMRVLIGLAVGAALLVLGEIAFARLRGIVGPVLVAVGLAVISLALFASTRLYDLVDVEWALAGAFVAAVAAAAIAVRHDSQLVAAFGLIAVLAAPPVLGASPTIVTLLFVAATLIGTTAVALFRTWTWLPPLAFVLAAPQVASYVAGGPPLLDGLIAVTGFWLVNVIAAGGEEFRRPTDRLRTATVTLLLADAAFTLWAGFTLLSGDAAVWRGAFLAVGAILHLAIGLAFLARHGDRHPFGLAVAATGIAALTMAVPVQAGGPPVPIAWAAEAVALAWVAALRRHPYSAAVAILLGVMALGHLVAFEYPPEDIAAGFVRTVPFVGPEGITFAFMIAALAVAGLGVPIAWVRAGLAVVGGLLAIYVFPFELSGAALVAGWSAIAVAGMAALARVVAPRIPWSFRERRTAALALPASVAEPIGVLVEAVSASVLPLFTAAVLLAGIASLGHLVVFDYPLTAIVDGTPHAIPFVGLPGLSFAIVLVALAAAGLLVAVPWIRVALVASGGLVATYVFPFELAGPDLVWAWSLLATGAFALEARVIAPRLAPALATLPGRAVRPSILAVGAVAGIAAIGHVVILDFPPADLGQVILSAPPYVGPEGLSLVAVLAGLAVSAWVLAARWVRLGAAGIAAALLTYTVTFEVAQPAVTVAWAVLALASTALVRRLAPVPLIPSATAPILEAVGERLPYGAAALSVLFLAVRAYWLADAPDLARRLTGSLPLSGTPFIDERTFVLAVLAATLAIAGWVWGGATARLWGGLAAGAVVAWLLPFEVRVGYAVAGWCLLALAAVAVIRVAPAARVLLGTAALILAGLAALVALAIVAPPDRLVVDGSTVVVRLGPLTDAMVALGALALALAVGAVLHRAEQLSLAALAAAGVVAVYLLSITVVDAFQVQVATRALEDLQKEAQVGLSVLWSVLGGIVFAIGLATRRTPVRLFGLALLGLATVKVFLVDLAALDVAYRVLSLVALGVLLLISAAVYSRIQHPHGPVAPRHA